MRGPCRELAWLTDGRYRFLQIHLRDGPGRKADPLCRCRRLLTKAEERLSEGGREKLLGLLTSENLSQFLLLRSVGLQP